VSPSLEIDALPKLRDPVMIVALSGWVDAGLAGIGSLAVLRDHLGSARRFARMDLSDVMDLQQTRPTLHLEGGVQRTIEWPAIELVAGQLGSDVVLCSGPEPSLRWRAVLTELVGAARDLGVRRAYTLGGIPAMASHRRPVDVLVTASDDDLADECDASDQDYEGPVGAQSVLQVMLGEAGIPTVGLWAQVPHYLAASASPPAIRSLLVKLRDQAGIAVDLAELEETAVEYIQRVESGVSERLDVLEAIRAIEDADDGTDDDPLTPGPLDDDELPSGDELASEIERFLRGQ
jgi:GAF domain-containing protein